MKNIYLILIITLLPGLVLAQADIQPIVSPSSFGPQTEITVTYDVTGTTLEDLEEAFIWVWIPGANIDAKYNVNPASVDPVLAENAKFTKTVDGDNTLFSITFVPQDFFAEPICIETQLGMLIKGDDWSSGQSVDHISSMTPLANCFVVKLLAPLDDPVFVDVGSTLSVAAQSSETATFTLTVDGVQVDQQTSIEDYVFDYAIPQSSGIYPVTLAVENAENDTTIAFSYLVNAPSEQQAKPAGVIPGVNYDENDATVATLCLLALGKSAVYLLGEFNGFEIAPENKMYRDGDYFWAEVTGLTPGQEYAYQYLADGIFIADPFADKILDPDDRYIPEAIYPDLKIYPEKALRDQWYKNRLAVLQTGQTPFQWQNTDFQRPIKTDLVIYELLMRDFFAEDDRNYLNLIDTLSYLKSLGVNAIELMPIQEFAGNNSWGYNPTFMFAPDKAYGTEQALKQFIDAAHGEGMAVILDVVFNHQDVPNPYVALWFDFANFKVTAENPMFNVDATHPFSVFYDMNHESALTQFYMDTTLHYWMDQYKVDGFRFDLSKGFTQTVNTDVGAWGARDDGRIALLKRMADKVWEYDPEAYLILEHFADNSEETELANYGLMLWGNMHWDYKDLAIGVEKNIAWAHHGGRGWDEPNVVAYMESHDEQRIMYELLNHGLSDGAYNVKDPETALNRIKTAAAFFYTIPGPKMLWQFQELGYDHPINLCEDGVSVNNGCRTSPKPVEWEYFMEEDRQKLFKVFQALINLKTRYEVFETGQFSITEGSTLIKEIKLINKDYISAPSGEDEMSVYVVGNFDVKPADVEANFPFSGNWYSFFEGGEISEIADVNMTLHLNPGEFKLFVNYPIDFPEDNLIPQVITSLKEKIQNGFSVYPNPSSGAVNITLDDPGSYELKVIDITGRTVLEEVNLKRTKNLSVDVEDIPAGFYLIKISNGERIYSTQLIKK